MKFKAATVDLRQYFDRVVLINLARRPDRLEHVQAALRACRWPFKTPEIFAAVDGRTAAPPAKWRHGPGAWGCLQSHRRVLGQAIKDKVRSLLVLEDDVCFIHNFRAEVRKFLRAVPDDWDQLMIGGQHLKRPLPVKPGIVQCLDCERTHCYAIHGEFMRLLHKRWGGGGRFKGDGHCDWIMGRDPELQAAHKVYAPRFFLAGQERSRSEIASAVMPRKFWNPPGPDLPVINLHAPPPVASALRRYGFYFGQVHDRKSTKSKNIDEIFQETAHDPAARVTALGEWIKVVQWEVATDPAYLCTVAHPLAAPELVKAASLWKVYEITADSVEEAIQKLPPKLRKLRMAK